MDDRQERELTSSERIKMNIYRKWLAEQALCWPIFLSVGSIIMAFLESSLEKDESRTLKIIYYVGEGLMILGSI